MIVKIKPVNAKINVSRQNGELVTTRSWFTAEDHVSNIGILGNLFLSQLYIRHHRVVI